MKILQNPTFKVWQNFATQLFTRYADHNNMTAAAAIAFYVIFALSPIFVFAVTFGGMILGNDGAKQAAVQFMSDYVGPAHAEQLIQTVRITAISPKAIIPTLLSVVVMMWSASAIFIQLQIALNTINGFAAADSLKSSIRNTALGRLRAMLFSLGTGLILAAGALISNWSHEDWLRLPLGDIIPDETQQWIIFHVASWLIVWIVFTSILYLLPMRRPLKVSALTGGTVATVLFQLGKYLIGLAAENNAAASAYGPASVMVVTVLWVFISAQIILFSAELGQLLFEPGVSPFRPYREGEHLPDEASPLP